MDQVSPTLGQAFSLVVMTGLMLHPMSNQPRQIHHHSSADVQAECKNKTDSNSDDKRMMLGL